MTLISHDLSAAPTAVPALTGRMIQLDVLRGIAILLVLGRHAAVNYANAGWLRLPALAWYNIGWTGVDLFFVLSGFLVGGLLLGELSKRGHIDVGRFIIRRLFKIWPAYYALILGSIALKAMRGGWLQALKLYWPNLLHVQNYFGNDLLIHTWSLAIEEHFYLLLPLLLLLLTRRPGGLAWLPWIAVMVMFFCTAARFALNFHRPFSLWTHVFPTHLRADGLAFGVLLAYLYQFRPDILQRASRRRGLLMGIGLAMAAPMMWYTQEENPWVCTAGFTALYLGYGCILIAFIYTPVDAAGGIMGRFFTTSLARSLAGIGLFSYSIYIWHLNLARQPVAKLSGQPIFARMGSTFRYLSFTILYVAVAIKAGVILAKLIEFPALALRDRLFPSRSGALRKSAP